MFLFTIEMDWFACLENEARNSHPFFLFFVVSQKRVTITEINNVTVSLVVDSC